MAKRVACMNNHRQIYLGYNLYANDFNGDSIRASSMNYTNSIVAHNWTNWTGYTFFHDDKMNLGALVPSYTGLGVLFDPSSRWSSNYEKAAKTQFALLKKGLPPTKWAAGTYVPRPPSWGNCPPIWSWSNKISYYHRQMASKLANNLAGAPLIHPVTKAIISRLKTPQAINICMLPMVYWNWGQTLFIHNSQGFNATYADGTVKWISITKSEDAIARTQGWWSWHFRTLADQNY